jgi:hypothetical protein
MWKTLGGFTAQISRFQHILPLSTAQINCSGSDLPFFRKPYLRRYQPSVSLPVNLPSAPSLAPSLLTPSLPSIGLPRLF